MRDGGNGEGGEEGGGGEDTGVRGGKRDDYAVDGYQVAV